MRAFLLVALALAACETPEPPPCPGTKVATFNFKPVDAAVDAGVGPECTFGDAGAPKSSAFIATVAWDPNGTAAAVCIQRPYADPYLGTHDGGQVTVQSTSTLDTLVGCDPGCAVTIQEVLDGGIEPPDGGTPTGFSGTLQSTLSGVLADGGASSCSCGLPCSVTYPLVGTPEARP